MSHWYEHDRFVIRQKVFKLFGAAFHVYDEAGNVLLYSKQKAFKLKEDIRLYASEAMQQELLVIKARKAIDFSSAYDVVDPTTNEHVGALARKGLKSILRDEWHVLTPQGQTVARILEDSTALAIVRRFVEAASMFLPQKYHMELNGQQVARFHQNVNPFVRKLSVEFSPYLNSVMDRRLALAAGILLAAVEGRQG